MRMTLPVLVLAGAMALTGYGSPGAAAVRGTGAAGLVEAPPGVAATSFARRPPSVGSTVASRTVSGRGASSTAVARRELLSGLGATERTWFARHRRDDCPVWSCAGPALDGNFGDDFEFVNVAFIDGRVVSYEQTFRTWKTVHAALSAVLALLPRDTDVVNSGLVEHDRSGLSCRWYDLTSATLGRVLGGSHASVELGAADASADWSSPPDPVNQADVTDAWLPFGGGC